MIEGTAVRFSVAAAGSLDRYNAPWTVSLRVCLPTCLLACFYRLYFVESSIQFYPTMYTERPSFDPKPAVVLFAAVVVSGCKAIQQLQARRRKESLR